MHDAKDDIDTLRAEVDALRRRFKAQGATLDSAEAEVRQLRGQRQEALAEALLHAEALLVEPCRPLQIGDKLVFLDMAHYTMVKTTNFNGVRMPSIATGAVAANRDLYYIGVSGDGDTLSIGFGQFAHAIRRNLDMLYMIENNGVYGLTKGQFSASADVGSKARRTCSRRSIQCSRR